MLWVLKNSCLGRLVNPPLRKETIDKNMIRIRIRNFLASTAVILVVALVSLEVMACILSLSGLLWVNDVPRFWQFSSNGKEVPRKDWLTEIDEWGPWHLASSRTRAVKNCFNVTYQSNEVGARDESFSGEKSKERYLLLGDSFAEGFGVNLEDSFQYLLEKKLGIEIFNFGASGDVGPVQYWLIYERLAKKYVHDGLIIFFLPDNDFTDNEFAYWSDRAYRWRPYYRWNASTNQYDYFIPENAAKRFGSQRNLFMGILENDLWSYNVYLTVQFILESRRASQKQKGSYSGYFDPTLEQQKAAVHFIDRIIADSNAKDIVLVAIPRPPDFDAISKGRKKVEMFWWSQFASAGQRLRKPVTFVDLADSRPADVASLFLSCDGHWSPQGNEWAAEKIAPFLSVR